MSSLEELQALVHDKYGLDPSSLDPQASMREAGIDSLALVEFLFEVEDRYRVSLPATGIDTLAQLADAVDRLRSSQASAQAA
ncbi:acyl carrier protein [Piscinibacter sakaiensis]|uniref:Acyl carrier protein n=1 Tax=Piscinibacter sakaiensis TaxID=1547922 RepID=A0A0K8NU55_PISS1|nr:acyl carrier protein [Piscinibacter sakaiensis]GAP33789.1 hypothetical protein ISF6_1044 [Piscinibacter sakaiensis]